MNIDDGGIVSSDGQTFILWDKDSEDDDVIHLMIGIKKSSGMSNAQLDGNYTAGKFEENSGIISTVLYDLDFSGNGQATSLVLSHSAGGVYNDSNFSYTVASDGTYQDGGPNVGDVSSDGQMLVTPKKDFSACCRPSSPIRLVKLFSYKRLYSKLTR